MAETPNTDHALHLAMFMQRRDALQFGVVKDGEVTPSWEDSGQAQHEYLADAETTLAAVKVLGYVHAPQSLDTEALAEVLYDADMKMRYGHVKQSWAERQHGALKQMLRRTAEQILFGYDVTQKGKN